MWNSNFTQNNNNNNNINININVLFGTKAINHPLFLSPSSLTFFTVSKFEFLP